VPEKILFFLPLFPSSSSCSPQKKKKRQLEALSFAFSQQEYIETTKTP